MFCLFGKRGKRQEHVAKEPEESHPKRRLEMGMMERKKEKEMKHEGEAATKYVLVPQLRQNCCTPAMLAFSPQNVN
jgi:hypothetical protein